MAAEQPAREAETVATGPAHAGFTLIELLVVIGIIGLLISVLVPALAAARDHAKSTKCLANLHVLGQGISIYANDNLDLLIPGRLPKIPGDDCNPYADILGGRKYRPTFLAMMSAAVGAPPFADPKACKNQTDRDGEPGDQQNFSYGTYLCPAVPHWTDERNGAYGYNYQFLGNSRVFDDALPHSYKHWPVPLTDVPHAARTVAVADSMGTAASFPTPARREYVNNGRDADLFGNEGFNLDPPRVDPVNGEMADAPDHRTSADPRHRGRAGVLWVDGHVSAETLRQLGYQVNPDGRVAHDGEEADNSRWSGNAADIPWTPEFAP
jgi:prepilin-type N-terminal cleavage/methylation domain-containing protein/prepilin-type processing-associated H-X9-DG protein